MAASSRTSARSTPARSRDPRKRDARKQPRRGAEVPRIWTKPLRELTPETSLGFSVIEFARDVLLFQLLPWQKWLLVHALELRLDGSLRFRNVVVLVARQNGKSTLSQVLSLWWLYVCGVRLVLGTAQDLDTAEEVWQGAVDLVQETDEDDEPVRPELAALVKTVVQVNGKKSLNLTTGERYKIKAANRRAGRGLSGDRIILDELREHQSWESWGAITKTTMARPGAQIWCFSNAGDTTSVVLRYLRKLAHAALGDPDGLNARDGVGELPTEDELLDIAEWDAELDDLEAEDLAVDEDDLGIFEWSAAPGCDVDDREAWAQANPSLGYTITERTVASAARTDPEWIFRTEVLCQWSEGTLEGPFPPGSWEKCAAQLRNGELPPAERIIPDRRVVSCLEVSKDRGTAFVDVAGYRQDGHKQVEVLATRPGTAWVVDWYCDPEHGERARWPIAIRVGSPAWTLAEDLREAGLEVVEWKGQEVGVGCGNLYDEVRNHELRHTSQPVLNTPASTAVTKPLENGAWVWDQKRSPQEIAALIAATGAHWLLSKAVAEPPPPKPRPKVIRGSARSSATDAAHAAF